MPTSAAHAAAAAAGPAFRELPLVPMLRRWATAQFALFIALVAFALIDPSPYDFVAIPTIALWLALGARLHRGAYLFVAILVVFTLAKLAALLPYLDEPDPVGWVINSTYLAITGIFFAMFFSDESERRVELAMKAYVAGCVVAACAGIAGYFDVGGSGAVFSLYGRASGTFKDPNVFGSFLVPGIVFLVHGLATGRTRRTLTALLCLTLLLAGVFLSFSRGSWGATVVGTTVCVALAFSTSPGPVRQRILVISVLTAMAGAAVLTALLSVDEIAQKFLMRAQVTQDYDEGVTGRFGNQMRAIPMLIEDPMGFGPLRFRLTFGLEPHNSYIGAFANAGWLGGFCFFALVITTIFVGLRLCLMESPFRSVAQTVAPSVLVLLLQGFQIDVDHWRFLYILMGAVWGLEAARQDWRAGQGPAARLQAARA